MKIIKYLAAMFLASTLVACGSDPVEQIYKEVQINYSGAKTDLTLLDRQLDRGSLKNAILLKSYAKYARQKKPDFAEIIDVLESESTKQGPTYKQITQRLSDIEPQVSSRPKTVEAASSTNFELLNIQTAIANYDAMLVDAINVLSEFTDGALPKLREIEFEDSQAEGGDIGSQYVGNSAYGQWRTNSSGNSFWHWYGQYAFFSSMFRGPVYYDHWSHNRRPSYYHDRANGAYTSSNSRKNDSDALSRTKKSYTSKGKSFKSPYARNTRIKGVAGSTAKSGAKPFKSSYAKSTSTSSKKTYKSAYNSRSSSSGRSSFGGK